MITARLKIRQLGSNGRYLQSNGEWGDWHTAVEFLTEFDANDFALTNGLTYRNYGVFYKRCRMDNSFLPQMSKNALHSM